PKLVAYVESGSKDVHEFFEANKWLYADTRDIEDAYETLDRQIAIRSGFVEELEDGPSGSAPRAAAGPKVDAKRPALGLDEFRQRWRTRASEHEDFPSGYFETPDGTRIGVRIVSSTTGLGDAGGDRL